MPQGDPAAWYERIAMELPNIRAALAAANGPARLKAASDLIDFWIARGHVREGRRVIKQAEDYLDSIGEENRATILLRLGVLTWLTGDLDRARAP
jgi:hypothetical protein